MELKRRILLLQASTFHRCVVMCFAKIHFEAFLSVAFAYITLMTVFAEKGCDSVPEGRNDNREHILSICGESISLCERIWLERKKNVNNCVTWFSARWRFGSSYKQEVNTDARAEVFLTVIYVVLTFVLPKGHEGVMRGVTFSCLLVLRSGIEPRLGYYFVFVLFLHAVFLVQYCTYKLSARVVTNEWHKSWNG